MEPMTMLAIGSAVAGGVSSIFGGKAQGAAIRRQNEQAMRDWIRGNSQISLNNARDQFQNAYAFAQQLKRNNAIAQAAYGYQYDSKEALNNETSFQQSQLSNQIMQQKASLLNAMSGRGVSSNSGMYGALATMQSLNSLSNAMQLEKNRMAQIKNINQQTQNMLNQQTDNIFMPNIELYNDAPIFGDSSAAESGGMISGLLQIGGALGAAGLEGMKSTPTATTSKSNQYGTNLSKAPSGYTYNSTASQTTFQRTSSPSSTLNWYRR
jgi:uncharacterized UPF0146 family protein